VPIYRKTHYVMPQAQRDRAIVSIQEELLVVEKKKWKAGKIRGGAALGAANHV